MRLGFVIFAALLAPLSVQADTEALNRAVSSCWDVGAVSTNGLKAVLSLRAEFKQDGSAAAVKLLSIDAPSEAGGKSAYEAARRAVMRCARQNGGTVDRVVFTFDYRSMTVTSQRDNEAFKPTEI